MRALQIRIAKGAIDKPWGSNRVGKICHAKATVPELAEEGRALQFCFGEITANKSFTQIGSELPCYEEAGPNIAKPKLSGPRPSPKGKVKVAKRDPFDEVRNVESS